MIMITIVTINHNTNTTTTTTNNNDNNNIQWANKGRDVRCASPMPKFKPSA